jgi:putative intracellular protease/amidase
MQAGLQGKKVALVATEDATQASAWRRALEQAGAVVEAITPGSGSISAALDYEALVAIGAPGDGPADRARPQFPREVVQLVKELALVEKPVIALGSAVLLLAEADVVRGRQVSASESARERLQEAGAHVTGEPSTKDERLYTGTGVDADAATLVASLGSAVTQLAVDRTSEQSFPASDPPPSPTSV